MHYRREIDGLRAVAVLPVILFHAGMTFWSGGYVGVDVFFVISGYLITTILIEQRVRGTYSILNFYERRARRILPALFVVLLACIPFAWMWLPPYPLEDFARSMAFAALFISNVHFLEHGGYFDLDADLRPLLHTWSLAVEEQYYLLFPLVLFALGRFRRRKFLIAFAVLALASLAVAEWGWRKYPDENFYFTPSRLWELLAGSLCAAILFRRKVMRSDLLAGLGLGAILLATVWYDAAMPFPSYWTLLPVVGTCLIILFAESTTRTARLLSLRPLVGVGLVSYSAYLWHQPLFAFARIRGAGEVAPWVMWVLVVLSLVLAWASWRFVEQPFRGRAPLLLPGRRGLLGASAAGIAAIAAVGFWTMAEKGFESRLDIASSPFLARLYDETTRHPTAERLCAEDKGKDLRDLCTAYAPEAPAGRIAVLGDSHSRVLVPAFADLSERRALTVVLGDHPGCPPLLGVWLIRGGTAARACHDSAVHFAEQVVGSGTGTVVLAARWAMYATGFYGNHDWRTAVTTDPGQSFITQAERLEELEKGLHHTIDFYRGHDIDVILFAQVPEQRQIPSILVQNAMLMGLDDATARGMFERSFVLRAENDRLHAGARAVLERVAREAGVPLVVSDPEFAEGERYAWLRGEDSLYLDDDHLSEVGARSLAPLMERAFEELGS